MVAMPIVVIALGMFIQTLTAGSALRNTGQDRWGASSAAQDTLEIMRNETFADLVRLFNADPFDDPMGPGTAPGNAFDIEGMLAREGDPDGRVGRILLPMRNAGTEVAPIWELREDIVDAEMGMPRDLNGDGVIQDTRLEEGFSILPVIVNIEWQGHFGPGEFTLATVLTEVMP